MRSACLFVAILACLSAPRGASAQAQGTFPASIVCDAAGPAGRERASFALDLAPDGRASYRLKLGGAPIETGTGRLAGRVLSLAGSAAGRYASRYTGEITGRGGVLAGTQTPGKGGAPRPCQIRLGDG